MNIILSYSLFLLFPILARAIIFLKKRKEMGYWLPGWLIGFAQDLTIASIFIVLYNLGIPFFLIAILLVYHLLDAFLLIAADFRMKFSFFRYLFEFKDFQSSAEEMGIRFLSIILVLAYLGLYALSWIHSYPPVFSVSLLVLVLSIGMLGIVFKGKMYFYSNPLFQEALNYLLPFIQKEEKQEQLSVIPSQCEIAKPISPHYPLLKMTEGFIGEKLFNIRIEKNEKPHVILIALESFGVKYLGCIGQHCGATPNLDRMAKEGILFSNFHAAGIPTSRSLQSTLFGIHPDLDSISLQERNPLYPLIGIQDLLKNDGYHTVYHKGGSLLFLNAIKYLKSHGFNELAGDEQVIEALAKGSRMSWGVHDAELFDYSFQRLQQLDKEDKSAFMMICTISNHHPWQVPEGFKAPGFNVNSPLLERYLQTVYYTDASLGTFIDKLKKSGISKNSIIIITADNGQPMGEHDDNYMPLKEVYEENHKIPLIIYADGRIDNPAKINTVGSQVDIMPTIMDICSLKGINHSIGTSLMRQAPERHAFCVNTHILPYISHNEGAYKYCLRLDTDHRQLFNLAEDPEEKNNILDKMPDIAQKLHTQLIRHFMSLQKLYTEHRITPATDRSIVLLGDNEVSDNTLIQEVKKHKTLNSILISECSQITDEGFIQAVKKVEQLEFLYINKLHLTGESLDALEGKTQNLKELTLSYSLGISSQHMTRLLANCPNLEELTLSGNIQVQDEVLSTIAEFCPKLQNLELSECFGITDNGFEALSSGCPSLNRLNLQGLSSVTDKTLNILAKGTYDLHSFHILNCPDITGDSLWKVCDKNRSLRRLSFTGDAVDNETITKISKHCPEMMKLLIIGCEQFSAESFVSIAKNFQKLVILELANCPNLTDAFFENLADKPLDHLLIAGAPQVTNQALPHIQKISTLRTLILYHCPNIKEDSLMEAGAQMNKTGILHEITFNRTKKVFYSKNR